MGKLIAFFKVPKSGSAFPSNSSGVRTSKSIIPGCALIYAHISEGCMVLKWMVDFYTKGILQCVHSPALL